MTNPPNNPDRPKAVRDGYEPAPFFFVQTSESAGSRVVAWAPALPTMRDAFLALIKLLPDSLEVLLKVAVDDEHADGKSRQTESADAWQRHYGLVARGALLEAIERCSEFVFQDSRNQLCVRDPISFDYVVLDHVGVIYVYSDEAAFHDLFARLGFEQRFEGLISDEWSWSQLPAAGPEQEVEFIRLLRLSPAPGPGESHDDKTLQ